jgi:hypothetical protein
MPVPEGYVKPRMSRNVNGNIFAIVGSAMDAMKKAKISKVIQEQMAEEVMGTPSYDKALQEVMKWVEIV